ncbi:MAG: M56 family metallopeptidase [Phycisphaerales bacterium]
MYDTLLDGSLIVDALWQPTLCLLIASVVAALLARQPARAHHAVLLLLGAAVVTPLISAAFRALGWGLIAPPSLATLESTASDQIPALSMNYLASAFTWERLFGAVWIVLSIVVIVRLVQSIRSSRRLLRDSRPLDDPRIEALANQAARKLGLWCTPTVRVSEIITCPVVWCWSKEPLILLPVEMADEPDAKALAGILCHELAHWKRRDHLSVFVSEVLACAMPWHPMVWWTKRHMAQLSEQACDQWVLATGQSPTVFAESLLNLAPQRGNRLALAAVTNKHGLVRRIQHILDGSERHSPHTSRARLALFVGIAMLLSTTAALAHRRVQVVTSDIGAPAGESTAIDDQLARIDRESPFIVRVTPSELDLGIGEPGKPKPGKLWLINTGSTPMQVERAKVACGCTTITRFETGALAPGASMLVELTMTAPNNPGERKTKDVTFFIQGQPPLKVPIHLEAGRFDT